MVNEVQTQAGRCSAHGNVEATREVPEMGFRFVVYALRRAIARRRPFRCPECGTSFLADPVFRRQAAETTGLAEATLEASAVADPHVTVKADVQRLLTAPSLTPKVSVSGHVYDIATGRLATTLDARYP